MKSAIGFISTLLLLTAGLIFLPGESSAQGAKMIVGQAGVNPGAGLFSIAVKQGFYKKHGLDVEIIKTNTTAAVQAMLANKMQMATGAGAAAFVTATLEGAPPFVLVGSWVNVFPYKIMAHKGIKNIADLKGKTGHVGAPFGTIPDTALRFALNRLKIDPEKDVKLVQHSGADPVSILAAMEKGEVQFGILAPPFDLIAEKRGYEMLLALPGLGIPWQQNGELLPRSYLKSNRDNVVRFLRATADASKFYFDQKEKTIDIMSEYLGRPRDETEYAYNQFKRWVDKNHRPQVDTIKTTLEAIKKTTPKAASANAASFIDTSIVDQLVKEGYYK
ncbi:MAG TPA: ABC transporter substrate-binding protein [Candidatus Binatia bacterium]|jgi:ABC-type nitrate/sulfonate/bicarbonate transport system substrate-binding protein